MKNRRCYVLSLIISQLLMMVAWVQPTTTPDSLLRYLKTAKQDTSQGTRLQLVVGL